MARLKCEDCSYFWWSDEYDRKMCMYPSEDPWPAPCEEEDTELDSWEEYLDLDD